MVDPKSRPVGGTELNWCRAVRGGTGITTLALLTTKLPDPSRLQNALGQLQDSHPILRSRLRYSPNATTSYSFVTSPTAFVKISYKKLSTVSVSPLQDVLEVELNRNTWREARDCDSDMLFASVYTVEQGWVVVLRLHVAACDRTTAVALLRELLVLMEEEEEEEKEGLNEKEIGLAIEDLVPREKAKKAVWARGLDVLSYSINSLRLTNLKFNDSKSARFSQVVRLQLNQHDTKGVLAGCKLSGIKLCGAVAAAGLMAAHCSYHRSSKKYGIVTLTDCRSSLHPPPSDTFGFYHSAILNSHEVKTGESLWSLAKRAYGAFENSKKGNKHFSDMADLNFLMCKAIENPGLTSSSSLRTSLMSVFEDTVVDNECKKQREVGVEDYMGCASVHGVGPSIAIFDTIRDGSLDCVCVYPAPLHSREPMQELVGKMKELLVAAARTYED